MRDRRRNGFSASSGLATRTSRPERPMSACAAAETKVSVQPSDAPSPHRTSLRNRRDRCNDVSRPGWGHVGTRRGTLLYPNMRAISSITSSTP